MKKRLMVMACLIFMAGLVMAQVRVFTGKVVDSNGEPVIGATVLVKGTNTGIATDINGDFSVKSQANAILRVSYVGMVTREIKVGSHMKIVLESDSKVLDEVMVVAYGTQKKSSFTGSAGVVNADKIGERVVSNLSNVLAGAVAGVQAINNSGQPGKDAKIRIRGIGSMSSSNAPLYVVDGVPYDSDISAINPTDIESMTVLKDAAADAIYGARGANGVVLITTKSGKSGEAKITFDAKWGTNSRMVPKYNVIGTAEYYETQYKAMYNSQLYAGKTAAESATYANTKLLDASNGGLGYLVYTVPTGENLIGSDFKLNPNAKLGYSDGTYYYRPDNWYDEAFGNNLRQEYNATVSGNSGKLNYYGSVGYLNDTGLIANSAFKRYTGRAKIDYQAKSWLKVGSNMSLTYSDLQSPEYQDGDNWGSTANLFYYVNSIAPIYPLYVRDATGKIKYDSATGKRVYDAGTTTNFSRPGFTGNPVRDMELNKQHQYSDNLQSKFYAQLTPIEGLTLTANVAANVQNSRLNELQSRFGSAVSSDGDVYLETNRYFGVNNQYLASYITTIGGHHNLDFLAGYEQYRYKHQCFNGENTDLYDPFLGELNNAGGTSKKIAKSYTDNYMTEGFLSRIQYNYDNKYFLSTSYRRDASSRFAEGHRWGNFGSIGGAWLISKENFMESTKGWLNSLKLKASWGVQGNDALYLNKAKEIQNYYVYKDQYNVTYNESTKQYSLSLAYKGNSDLTWETSYSVNIGTDFELFNSRLNGTIEYFSRLTCNLLYNKPVAVSSGVVTGYIPENIGSVMNKGFEVDLNAIPVKTHDFEWGVNFNITHYSNKIKSLSPELEANGGEKGSYYIYRVGGSLYNSYLKSYAGVDQKTGEALYYVDPDKGNYTTTNDYTQAALADQGSTLPKVYGGLGTTLKYKGFDFAIYASYQLGGKFYDGAYQAFMHNGGSGMQGNNWSVDIRKAWTLTNTNTNVPRLDASDDCYQIDSNRFLKNSDYLSINNISLGYTVPKSLLTLFGVSSLRLYFAADNVFLFARRKGLDPRESLGVGSSTHESGAESSSSYSAMRTLTGGLTLTF